MKKSKKKKNGFTLIEVLLAVSIFIIGVVMIFQVEIFTISNFERINSKFKAAFLAQEGIEVVRNIRDTNWLQDQDWRTSLGLVSLSPEVVASVTSNVEYNSIAPNDVGNSLYIDGSNFYTHNSAGTTLTIFSRHIEIDYLADGDGIGYMQVKSIVDWSLKGKNYSITIEDHLYDWR